MRSLQSGFSPREWFIAPLHIIEAAANMLINGNIVNYRYDADAQNIEERSLSEILTGSWDLYIEFERPDTITFTYDEEPENSVRS